MPAFDSAGAPRPETIFSVSQLTDIIKEVLEQTFPHVWVAGEISNFSRPSSGHSYFTLKDEAAQIRAVAWRNVGAGLKFQLHDGLKILCRGHLDLYPPRGSYQLVVDEIIPQGLGALELALRQLRDKLAAEGLFDPARKRPLPGFPARVAFVTSPTGAAVHDFLQVLQRRASGVDVLIVPTRVQGEGAAEEIAAAIDLVNRLVPALDVVVVGRGGGSIEDLWAFNSEVVVRAIHRSAVPVISAVGHEIDVTLADLVADVRALTPTEAGERIAPAADELRQQLGHLQRQLTSGLVHRMKLAERQIEQLASSRVLRRPLERIELLARTLDELELRGKRGIKTRLSETEQKLAQGAAQLESLSPLAVLARGYSLTQRTDGSLVRKLGDVARGDRLVTRLIDGQVVSQVE